MLSIVMYVVYKFDTVCKLIDHLLSNSEMICMHVDPINHPIQFNPDSGEDAIIAN